MPKCRINLYDICHTLELGFHYPVSRHSYISFTTSSPPLIEIDSSPDEYLFYKEAIVKLKLQPLGRILFQVYRKP